MSPEQLRSSKNVDTRTDIWALGIILYELVSGRFPFEDETVTGLCARIAADPPVPLHEHLPDVPPAFEAVVARCLSKNMKDRPQTVGELAAALRPFASPEAQLAVDRIVRIGGSARTGPAGVPDGLPSSPGSHGIVSVRGGVRSTTGFADTVGATSQVTNAGPGRRTTMLVGVGALVALALGGGLYLALRSAPGRVVAPDTPAVTTAIPAPAAPPVLAASSAPPMVSAPSASAPAASVPPTPTRPPGWPTTTPPRTTARPAPTTKPPTSDDLLLDRK
jgi:serine/threonine-protein kinase